MTPVQSAPNFGSAYHPSFGSYMFNNGPSWGDFLLWNMIFSMNDNDRREFDELNKDNAELKAKLDALDKKFTAEGKKPDANYWPAEVPREAALSEATVEAANKSASSVSTAKEEEDYLLWALAGIACLAILAGAVIYAVRGS